MALSLNAAEILALNKLLTEKVVKEARAAIDPEGEHFNLDFTVHITGKLEIEEMQYDVPQINRLNPWQLLKAAMDDFNENTINAFVKKALSMPEFDADTNDMDKQFKTRTEKAWKKMADSTRQDRNGKIVATGLEVTKVKN